MLASNKTINFQGLLVDLLSKLSEREQDVLKQRYQLTSDLKKRATLRQIGEIYNITRERVRQIERDAILKLEELGRAQEFANQLKQIEDLLIHQLESQGGLGREDHLLAHFVKDTHALDFFHTNAYLFVLEHLFENVERVADHDYFYNIWKLGRMDLNKVINLVKDLSNHLEINKKLHSQEEILGLAKEKLSSDWRQELELTLKNHAGVALEHWLESYLEATSKVEKNILNQWGLSHWQTIRPKKLGDKIHLIFQVHKKPLHFRDIAEGINHSDLGGKKICPATVHNELIANENFVLVGRGLYALKDWGLSTGTVAEIITRLLQAAKSQTLKKEEIYDQVLKQRPVNKSTIYLTLINKPQFEKLPNGEFRLKA